MKKIALIIAVLSLGNLFAAAQLKKYRWDTELCTFEGVYGAGKFTPKQLENTRRLYSTLDFEMDTFNATVFKYEDVGKLRTAESLETEYRKKAEALRNLEIVNTPYWTQYKQRKIESLERQYELARVSAAAYRKPATLKELKYADACVAKFADPLIAGGDDLLKIWGELNLEQRRKNSDPERVRREFEAQMASADRLNYARVEVTTFGWWNCVNAEIDRGDSDAADKNFRKLFTKVRRVSCDEP